MTWQLLYYTHTHTHTHAHTHTQCSTTVLKQSSFFLLCLKCWNECNSVEHSERGTQPSVTGTINSNGIKNKQQPVTWLLDLFVKISHLKVTKTQPQVLPLRAGQSEWVTSWTRPACVANVFIKQLPTQMHSGELNSKSKRYLFCVSNARTTKWNLQMMKKYLHIFYVFRQLVSSRPDFWNEILHEANSQNIPFCTLF